MLLGPLPICLGCSRNHPDDPDRLSCKAFPDGIPQPIIMNAADNWQPHPGAGGQQLLPVSPAVLASARRMFAPRHNASCR